LFGKSTRKSSFDTESSKQNDSFAKNLQNVRINDPVQNTTGQNNEKNIETTNKEKSEILQLN